MGSSCCVHCRWCGDTADDNHDSNNDDVGDSGEDEGSDCDRSGNSSRPTINSNPRLHLHHATPPTVVRMPQTLHPHDVPTQYPVEQQPDHRQAQLALSRPSASGGTERGIQLERLSSGGTQDPFSLDSSGGTLLAANARKLSYAQRSTSPSAGVAPDGTRINPLDIANLTPRSRQRAVAKNKEDAMDSHKQLLERAMKAINDAGANKVVTRPPRMKATTVTSPTVPPPGGHPTITFGEGSHPPTRRDSNTNSRLEHLSEDDEEPLVSNANRRGAPKPPGGGDEFSMSSADSEQSLLSSQHLIGASNTSAFISAGPLPSDHRGLAKMDGKSRRASVAPKGSGVYNASASGMHGLHGSASLLRDDRGAMEKESSIPENSILERSFDAGNMPGGANNGGGALGVEDHDTQNSSMLEVSVRNSFDQYLLEHMMKLHQNEKVTWFRGTPFTREELKNRERKGLIQFNSLVAVAEVTGGSYGGQLNESRTSSLTLSQNSSPAQTIPASGLERQLSAGHHSAQKAAYQTHVPSFPFPRKRATSELSVLIEASTSHENQLAKRLPQATAFVYQI